jgi:hypothetical protein
VWYTVPEAQAFGVGAGLAGPSGAVGDPPQPGAIAQHAAAILIVALGAVAR